MAVSDGVINAAVYHKGICEYEVTDDDTRTIGMTLLRCFRNAGNPTEVYEYQELAECQGKWEFDYWYAVNPGKVTDSALARTALDLVQPCYVMETTKHPGTLPGKLNFFTIANSDFVLSSVTEGETKNSLLLRGYCLAEEECRVDMAFYKPLMKAGKINLGNQVTDHLEIKDGHQVTFTAGRREIVTISLEWSENDGNE